MRGRPDDTAPVVKFVGHLLNLCSRMFMVCELRKKSHCTPPPCLISGLFQPKIIELEGLSLDARPCQPSARLSELRCSQCVSIALTAPQRTSAPNLKARLPQCARAFFIAEYLNSGP